MEKIISWPFLHRDPLDWLLITQAQHDVVHAHLPGALGCGRYKDKAPPVLETMPEALEENVLTFNAKMNKNCLFYLF